MATTRKSDRILWKARTGTILPPEASTSWILDHALLWQAVQGDCVVIDIADVERYQRLASKSYVDFLVAYLFALLINQRVLCPIDYRQFLPIGKRQEIARCAGALAQSNIQDGSRLFELAIRGYQQYIAYARSKSKEALYQDSENVPALNGFEKSKRAALKQLNMIENGTYEKTLLEQYAKRLVTKCLVASEIASRLSERYGVSLRVFDSPEYAVGADLLTSGHIISQVHRDKDFSFANLQLAGEIREKEATFAAGKYENSLVYTTVAAVLRPDLYVTIKEQIDAGDAPTPDVRRSIHATSVSTRQVLSNQSLFKNLTWSFLSFGVGLGTPGALLAIAQLLASLTHSRLAKSDCEHLTSSLTPIDEFTLLSTHIERNLARRKKGAWWTDWIKCIFRQPLQDDYRWQLSQKTMGMWVEAGVYVPWFENCAASE